jgi:4-hydroxythreonine-4-phosphate dehydrogenase
MVAKFEAKGSNYKKNIAITIGDPGGIGPEIAISVFNHEVSENSNIFLIGNSQLFIKAKKLKNINKDVNIIDSVDKFVPGKINIIDIPVKGNISFNKTSKTNGELAFTSIKYAITLANQKKIDAIVTSPISKEGLKLAGFDFPGHTEILAYYTNTKKYRMLFVSKYLNILLHTIHIPLKDVSAKIREVNLEDTIVMGYEFCKNYLKKKNPIIYISGLNPHAGENGNIGNEEKEYIIPIMKKFDYIDLKGPFPPDTIFFNALQNKPDLVIAMYHDQGLIPLKLIDFYGAVNVTLGIPFIRTSPDHGTAFDIAWQGIANNKSMLNAVKLAVFFVR